MNPSQVRRRLFEETQKDADNVTLYSNNEDREQGVSAQQTAVSLEYQPSSRSQMQVSGRETAERLSVHSSSDSSSLPGDSQRDESDYTDVHMLICLHEVRGLLRQMDRGLLRQMDHNVARRIGRSQSTEDGRGQMINRNLGEGVAR
jgi:hypothetical protein